jgi:NADPH:quinone reductase-like Zn-dependent oxidoreductase
MDTENDITGLQLRSLIRSSGDFELRLVPVAIPEPEADEVVVRVEAAPLNPSDIGLLLGAADITTAKSSASGDTAVVTATVPETAMKGMAGRVDQALPVGNEAAGTVVKAGASEAAQALLGKTVALMGGAMYTQYRTMKAAGCIALPDGITAAQGASFFVNPLTSLGMVETMRREGHKALVHTAAASNLGQMLNKICLKDGIDLVNIVRSPEQEKLLRGLGARHVCDSTSATFMDDLTQALAETGATLAFDAIGGGKLAGQILFCMEAALSKTAKVYSRYGSTTHKQIYLYGGLNPGPTEFNRNFGMAWGMGGWLVFPFIEKIGPVDAKRLRDRVAAELTSTFASHYTQVISLQELLQLDVLKATYKRATGEKFLINPNKVG